MNGGLVSPAAIVTLLTDFGLRDPYVGIVKGVMLSENPALRLVDLSHAVPPQDIGIGSFWIASAYAWFPPGTVHLCVVDPGVGGDRAPIAAQVGTHFFVAPDNGLLSDVLEPADASRVYRIDPQKLGLRVPARTFHARDIFGPVAARLASGALRLEDVGRAHQPVMLKRRVPRRDPRGVSGRVLVVDHFGNLISDIPAECVDPSQDHVHIAGRALRWVGTYEEAAPGECVGLFSSFGTVEVARRDGSAANDLGVERGASVRVEPAR